MTESKNTPVTLAEIFRYAEVYGVSITVSYEPRMPDRYVLKFSKDGQHRVDALQRIDLDRQDFDELCRYILTAGCEKLDRHFINNFVDTAVKPKFKEAKK